MTYGGSAEMPPTALDSARRSHAAGRARRGSQAPSGRRTRPVSRAGHGPLRVFFDAEHFGRDQLLAGDPFASLIDARNTGAQPASAAAFKAFLDKTPLPQQDRDALAPPGRWRHGLPGGHGRGRAAGLPEAHQLRGFPCATRPAWVSTASAFPQPQQRCLCPGRRRRIAVRCAGHRPAGRQERAAAQPQSTPWQVARIEALVCRWQCHAGAAAGAEHDPGRDEERQPR
ncbi:hypothetical protein ACU4GD_33145 [Cupriavidus basilensis]